MDYSVDMGKWSDIFAVPSKVVDDYIKLASGHAVKVLLYVLRNSKQKISKEEIVSSLGIDSETVEDAFNFWESVGILAPSEIPGKTASDTFRQQPKTIPQAPVREISQPQPANTQTPALKCDAPSANITVRRQPLSDSSRNFNLRPAEIAERVNTSNKIRTLFSLAEQSLGRMLSPVDQRSLIWIYEYLGLDVDVILTLISHCVSMGKESTAYIEKVAFQWHENNVTTLIDAQNEIQRHQRYEMYESMVMRIAGINTRPSANQSETIKLWYAKNVSPELVECAYNRTMDSTGKLSFPYMNAIIDSWVKNGLSTTADISDFEKNNSPYKRSYNKNGKNSVREEQSYDIDEFEKYAINYEQIRKVGE